MNTLLEPNRFDSGTRCAAAIACSWSGAAGLAGKAAGAGFAGLTAARELARRGHDVVVLPEAYSDTMGHAGAVVIHPNGTLEGAHDPRADGGAAGA